MLSRPLTLSKSDDRGRSLSAAAPPSALPLADEEETGPSAPAPTWSSSSSSSSSSCHLSPPLLSPPSSSDSPSCLAACTHRTSSVLSPPVAPPLPSLPSPCSAPLVSLTPSIPSPSFHLPPLSPAPAPASLHHLTSPIVSPPPPPPSLNAPHVSPSSVSCPSPLPGAHNYSSSPFPLVASSPLSSSSSSSSLPALAYSSSPPAPPPCCSCSSLLPRLLSIHRLEMRRLLRGALASIGHRLDALERRSRKRRKNRSKQRAKESACSPGSLTFASTSNCSPAPPPAVGFSSSSSSDCEESHTPPPAPSFSQLEQKRKRYRTEVSRRKRRKHNRGGGITGGKDEDEDEDEDGRFVGRMAVSFRGGRDADKDAPLTLLSFNQRKHNSQSENAVGVNGFRALPQLYGSSYKHVVQLLQPSPSAQTCSQSEAFTVSLSQWRFSGIAPPLSPSSSFTACHVWLRSSSSSSFSSAPMLPLTRVAVAMVSDLIRGEACWSPTRPLKDRTAPPSVSSDHCYVRKPLPSLTFSAQLQQKQRTNRSGRSLHLPWRCPLPLPACSANEFSSPLPAVQSAAGSKFFSRTGETGKRVSQIRIRRATPREMPLTPMGLPKVKRLKKKEFSLEEIYTNKNYKSPTSNRSLETIFEEPREKDGALLLIGQQRRRRLLLFPDFTQPRKRKRPQGAGLPVTMMPRKRMAARRHCHGSCHDDADLDVMLVERLSALEDFLTRQGLDV